ncbi:MAG: CheR family methyltransferase [Longimicrobiales bacterium]
MPAPDRGPAGRSAGQGRPSAGTPPGPTDFAVGELSPRDNAELQALKKQIQRDVGVFCEGYKERVLRRRIAVRMRARNVNTYRAYAAILEADAEEYNRLLDAVTINVSKFFRNASTWLTLRDTVVPALFAAETGVVNIWCAGVAAGEEAYSMAILLLQHAARTGERVDRFRLFGTDIDANVLERAKRGEYPAFAFTEMAESTRLRWFEGPQRTRLKDEVRSLVRFSKLDLMNDTFPTGQHLIFCRNVLIYFERSVQERMFQQFHDALLPGGWMQLGKVETLLGTSPNLFRTVSARERLFRRP